MANIIKPREIDLTDKNLALLEKLRSAIRNHILTEKRKHRGVNAFELNLKMLSGNSALLTDPVVECIVADLKEDGWTIRHYGNPAYSLIQVSRSEIKLL